MPHGELRRWGNKVQECVEPGRRAPRDAYWPLDLRRDVWQHDGMKSGLESSERPRLTLSQRREETLAVLRETAACLDQDRRALARGIWRRILARHPDAREWPLERLVEEVNGEIRVLGRVSHSTTISLRVQVDNLAKRGR